MKAIYNEFVKSGVLLNEDDELFKVALTDGEKDIILGASNGKGIRFSESDIRPMGRISAGVRGLLVADGEKMVGMAIGETKDLSVTFPAEYHAENLKGKDAVFTVTVNKIEVKELPALDDEFAKDVSEFDTLKELNLSLKEIKEYLETNVFYPSTFRKLCYWLCLLFDVLENEKANPYIGKRSFFDKRT